MSVGNVRTNLRTLVIREQSSIFITNYVGLYDGNSTEKNIILLFLTTQN
jgi:hypothetical protein